MSQFYDQASLVMVPSGYKDGKLYSQKPLSTSGELSFSRGSDIEATRIGGDGLIHKAQVNLLLQSNSFDTTWYNSNSTETSGQSGYDGSSDAWKLTKSASSAYIRQDLTGSGVFTFSVYAKASTDGGDSDGIYMLINGSPDSWATFDLNNGTTSLGAGGSVDSKIEAIGSGWYRCSLTGSGGVDDVRIYPAAEDGTYTDTTGAVFIQDAQLNYGLVAQTYQETTTAAVVSGITDNMPRLNYDPANPTCPSLLLEGSRTNEVAFSEYLNGDIWIQSGTSVTDNDATSPEGVINAAKVAGDGTDTQIRLYDNYTFPSTGNYVLSVFAKAGNNDFIALAYKGVDGGITAYYDLSEGTTSDSTNGTIEAVGTDGWYRCSLKADLTGPDLTGNYNIYVAKDLTTTTFPSNGDANGQYVHAYGFQCEAGSYPTSYIPTYGSSATRTADACSKTGISSLIGSSEGTLFIEGSAIANESTSKRISLSDGTNNNRVVIAYRDSQIDAIVVSGGSVSLSSGTGITTPEQNHKIAIAYKQNDFKVYVDGVEEISDTSGNTFTALSQVQFTDGNGSSSPFAGNVKQVLLFTTRLTNAQLAELTA